jgi:hypothetical protein
MSTDGTVGERISLTMRTSWLSEFRTASGVLVMFEIVGQRTTFGQLCALLARISGVEFADFKIPARYTGPTRLRFKGQDFDVSMAQLDYRVRALDPAAHPSKAGELLAQVKQQLNPRATQVRAHRLV